MKKNLKHRKVVVKEYTKLYKKDSNLIDFIKTYKLTSLNFE